MTKPYESYPIFIPALSSLLSLTIYAIGATLLSGNWVAVSLYLIFCLCFEYRVLSGSCRSCYYYGKLCGTGKGLLAPLFVKKGDPKLFLAKDISWRDMVPDLLVFLVPFLGGLAYLFISFNFLTLGLMVLIAVLAFPAVGYMRSCHICANCKQRVLGCPADKLFGNTKH